MLTSEYLLGTDHHIAGIGAMAERLGPHHKGRPGYEGYLNDRVVALQELLRDDGYETLMSGKWHLGQTQDRTPHARGFDRSFSLLVGCHNHFGWEPYIEQQDKETVPRLSKIPRNIYQEDDRPLPVSELPTDFYSSDFFTDKMLEYLADREKRQEDRPFFAYLPFSAPHWPVQAPKESIAKYRGAYDKGPEDLRQQRLARLKEMGLVPNDAVPAPVILRGEDGKETAPFEEMTEDEKAFSCRTMEAYAGCVDRMDYNIGRVLSHLEETNQLEDTCIMVFSDNGAEGAMWEAQPLAAGANLLEHIAKYHNNSLDNIGAKDSFAWYGAQWASASTAPGRLFKMYTSEGGIRVPFIFNYPRLNMKPRIDESFATVMDIFPTVLELAGTAPPGKTWRGREISPIKGKSWMPYLRGEEEKIHSHDEITGWELFGRMALRKGDYKALFIPKPHGPEKWQLFDLRTDQGEVNDLAETMPDKLAELISDFQQYALENGVIIQDASMRDAWDRGVAPGRT